MKTTVYLVLFFLFFVMNASSQVPDNSADTFEVAKTKELNEAKKRKLALNAFAPSNQRNPFLSYTGKIIRDIRVKSLGFESDINDSTKINIGFDIKVANALHKNTAVKVLQNNLLIKEGDHLNPYLLADNERHLRDLDYIQDAIIVVRKIPTSEDSVDVLVLVKDGFSIAPGVGIGGTKRFSLELKEENLAGTGNRIAASTFFDSDRKQKFGSGAEFLQRNIKGTFINWRAGYKTYNTAFNSNRNEETSYYIRVEKPLVSQYLRWMGALDLFYNNTKNGYRTDSLYLTDFRYRYYNIDGWFAYNFGTGKMKYQEVKSAIRKFVALRAFHQEFLDIPQKNSVAYSGTYSNLSGLLSSVSIFKQNYFRTTYIYGFGRNEDVPEGYSLSLIGGYTIKKDSLYNKTRTRPYYGFEALGGKYNKKGFYSSYTFRLGGFWYRGAWEDFDLLLYGDHFTKLKVLNSKWYRRYFFSGGITKQFIPVLEQPLFLRSQFGLPYFDEYNYISADFRATIKSEVVFYNTKKKYGFGFAPFGFADISLLKPTKENFSKSDFYSAIGAGFRVRNENLLFGTIEARVSYFPRVVPDMNHIKIQFSANLRYKYNNTFIRRPDFVTPN